MELRFEPCHPPLGSRFPRLTPVALGSSAPPQAWLSPPISQALLPCSATSHLSEVLFRPDARPLLGPQAGAVLQREGRGGSSGLAIAPDPGLARMAWEALAAQGLFPVAGPSVHGFTLLPPSRWGGMCSASPVSSCKPQQLRPFPGSFLPGGERGLRSGMERGDGEKEAQEEGMRGKQAGEAGQTL